MPAQPFRPRAASEIIDASVRLVRGHYAQLVMMSGIAFLPALLVELFFAPTDLTAEPRLSDFAVYWPMSLLGGLWFMLIDGAMVVAISDAYVGRTIDPAGAIRRAFARAGRVIATYLLRWLIPLGPIIAFAMVAAIVLAVIGTAGLASGLVVAALGLVTLAVVVYLYLRFLVAPAAVMLEEVGATGALGRSSVLTAGHKWRMLGLVLLVLVMFVALIAALAFVAAAFIQNVFVVGAIWQLVAVFLYPVPAAIVALLYFDLRIRKEGYDIELMAQELHGVVAVPTP